MRTRSFNVGVMLIVPTTLFVVWWFASQGTTSTFYPPLKNILVAFQQTWLFSHFSSDFIPSVRRLLIGYVFAVVIGIGFGALLGRIAAIARAMNPLVQFARSVPAPALLPIGLTLLGIGDPTKIGLIAFVCLFPVLLNTIDGVRSLDPALEDVGRCFRLTKRQRIFALQLPAAAPQILSGMRIALGLAFIMMIVTEMVGGTNGIGFQTLYAQQTFDIPTMWAGMILLGILGAALNIGFVMIERRVLDWRYAAPERP